MKTLFTFILVLILLRSTAEAQCSQGSPTYTGITVDGDIADWAPVLADPDNVTNDGTPDADMIVTPGRNFVRMAYTMNGVNLFVLFQRSGSANNQLSLGVYIDIDNNSGMENGEPVITLTWMGSNNLGTIAIYNYIPANPSGDSLRGDGNRMPGTLSHRVTLATNITVGTADGLSAEIYCPLDQIYRNNLYSVPYWRLEFGEMFNWHVSSVAGAATQLNTDAEDNWKRCDTRYRLLPVNLLNISGAHRDNNALINWTVDTNEEGAYFEIQKSTDGKIFKTAAKLHTSQKTGKENYSHKKLQPESKMYYRLRMVSREGAAHYSRIITIVAAGKMKENKIFLEQNPFYGELNPVFDAVSDGYGTVRIHNSSGALIYAYKTFFRSGPNKVDLPQNICHQKGIYTVEVITQQTRTSTKAVKL